MLDSRVLILNRLWQAVHIVCAKRAMALLFSGHARALHVNEDGLQVWPAEQWLEFSENCKQKTGVVVHTVNRLVRVPKVLLLHEYSDLPLKEVHLNRQSIFERDGHQCQYCGKIGKSHELNLDHVVPKERGGMLSWENIVTSCIRCNTHKSNRTPKEANMRLMKKPRQPKSRPFVAYIIGQQIDPEWKPFLHFGHEEVAVEIIGSDVELRSGAQIAG